MIRKASITVLLLLVGLASSAREKVVFMPQWRPQAQFAGYYVAQEKGFFAEENLDVVIKHPSQSTKIGSLDYLRSGDADIVTAQLISAIIAKDQGFDIANVLQTSQQSSLCCVSHKPISGVSDLNGLSMVRWKVGFSEIALLMEIENNLKIDWVQMLNPVNSYIFKATDAMLAMSYAEYYQLMLCIGKIPEENVIFLAEHGYNFPEDGLYVKSSYCRTHPSVISGFIRASEKGWQYAAEHPEETIEILISYMKKENAARSYVLQEFMLKEILDLQLDGTGKRSFAPVSRECYKELVDRSKAAGLIHSGPDYSKFFLQ